MARLRMPMTPRQIQKRRTHVLALLSLLLLVALLGLVSLRVSHSSSSSEPARQIGRQRPVVEFDRFSARSERTTDGERLSVSLRLRTGLKEEIECFVFVVARNDHVNPRLWSIWPPQPPGAAISVGGHFHGATPQTGQRLTLNETWQRITATIPRPDTSATYDTVVLYVLSSGGGTLLVRPFRV